MPNAAFSELRRGLGFEVHVWRWSGPRGDPRLEVLLAAYLDLPESALRWSIGPHGKPSLGAGMLAVNWSHCDGELLLAITEGTEVGVDLEMPRPLRRRQALLARAFTTGERAALEHVDDAEVLRAWAHKEALVKAMGRGIAYGLNRIELDLTEVSTPRLRGLSGPAAPASAWQIHALPQVDNALAAVAWAGGPRMIRQFYAPPATGRGPPASFVERPGAGWPQPTSTTSTN